MLALLPDSGRTEGGEVYLSNVVGDSEVERDLALLLDRSF